MDTEYLLTDRLLSDSSRESSECEIFGYGSLDDFLDADRSRIHGIQNTMCEKYESSEAHDCQSRVTNTCICGSIIGICIGVVLGMIFIFLSLSKSNDDCVNSTVLTRLITSTSFSVKYTEEQVYQIIRNGCNDFQRQNDVVLKNKTIYLIRHCEKYSDNSNGLSIDGDAHSVCLVSYFESFPLGKPQCVYGATSKTMRSIHTIVPISIELKIPMHGSWRSSRIKNAVDDIYGYLSRYDTILIAWEHHMIPKLATALGCVNCNSWNIDPRSSQTMNQLYDITWVLDYKDVRINNNTVSFTESPKLYTYNQNFDKGTCRDIANFTYIMKEFS